MAIIEEVEDESSPPKEDDLIVEELPDPIQAPSSAGAAPSVTELQDRVAQYREGPNATLESHITSLLPSFPVEVQASVLLPILSPEAALAIPDPQALALHLLSTTLRALFAAHPRLSSASRALSTPAGGTGAMDDMHEQTAWKQTSYPVSDVLAWCGSVLDARAVEKHIGLLLPPTLSMMDDWEPVWRARGARVLSSWIEKVDSEDLRRRGLDDLLLKSLIQTLSLHEDPSLHGVLEPTLRLIRPMHGEKKAKWYTEVVDNALIAGWTYAPGNAVAVLAHIAQAEETMCAELGTGIGRWLKSIIPALLEPLQHEPTASRLPLYAANISALKTTLETLSGTGRVERWRGQILDACARCWVQLSERPWEAQDVADRALQGLKAVYGLVAREVPSVRDEEFAELRKLDERIFGPLVAA